MDISEVSHHDAEIHADTALLLSDQQHYRERIILCSAHACEHLLYFPQAKTHSVVQIPKSLQADVAKYLQSVDWLSDAEAFVISKAPVKVR